MTNAWHLSCLLEHAGLPYAGASVFGPFWYTTHQTGGLGASDGRCGRCRVRFEDGDVGVNIPPRRYVLTRDQALELHADHDKAWIAEQFGLSVADIETILKGEPA